MGAVNPSLIKKIILPSVILACALGFPYARAANDDLTVEFERIPLFNEANFLPGEAVSRTVKVRNNTGTSQRITAEAINISDPHHLGAVLTLTIAEGRIVLFNGTLADFFANGTRMLSHLGAGAVTIYTYSVSFEPGAEDNGYQEKSLYFDLLVGFEGDAGGGDLSLVGGVGSQGSGGNSAGGGGGGGDSGGLLRGLTITGELIRVIEVGETTAIIEWGTSYESTSRVVYGTASGSFHFPTVPNYGYPFSTVESDTPAHSYGVLTHRVLISGLTPATTYYFRTVSHASPDTIGFEHTFTTAPARGSRGEALTASSGALSASGSSGMPTAVHTSQDTENKPATVKTTGVTAPPSPAPTDNNNQANALTPSDDAPFSSFLASVFSALPFSSGSVGVLALLPAIVLIVFWCRRARLK